MNPTSVNHSTAALYLHQMVGKTILHYQLLDKLGAGGMGEIYKAQDSRLNRIVAVKVLSPGMATDSERRRRFFQEAQAASALNHPNIITLHDIISDGDLQCIVMEYIAGKTMRELIPIGGLPVPVALQYATQMASALTAAHAAGIVHRDLKPSNIMVTGSGLVKILDFGLAKWIDPGPPTQFGEQAATVDAQLTKEGVIIGTVNYMSPEQAVGKRVDARSDIFSLGSVLYEMVTGRRAFEGTSGISTLSSILRDDVKPIYQLAPEVPPLFEQVILRCLPKDPNSRWQSMVEVDGALTALYRQLDPSGQYPLPMPGARTGASTITVPIPAAEPPSPNPAPANPGSAGSPRPPSGPRTAPDVAVPPVAGPAAQKTTPSKTTPSKATPLAWALAGILLIGAAGVGGWWLWKNRVGPAPEPVAQVTPPQAAPQTQPQAQPPTPAPEPPPTAPVQEAPPATPAPEVATKNPPAPEKSTRAIPKASAAKKTVAPPPKSKSAVANNEPTPAPTPTKTEEAAAPPPKPAPQAPAVQMVPVKIADALPFRIALAEDISSTSPEGKALRFTVLDGLVVGDKTVIAKGALVTGAIASEGGKKKFLGMGGSKMTFQLQQAESIDGKRINVRAASGKRADGPTTRPFDTGKGSKSKELSAAQGTEYIGYIDGEQTVSFRK